jgi:aminopeptidase N
LAKRQFSWLGTLSLILIGVGVVSQSWLAHQLYRLPAGTTGRDQYQITASYLPEQRLLTAKADISIRSLQGIPLRELVFHVYPNAFRFFATLPITSEQRDKAGLSDWQSGELQVTSVLLNQHATAWQVSDTILSIPLEQWQSPGSSFAVSISWQLQLPTGRMRLGVQDDVALFGNWYPVLAFHQGEGWRKDPYLPVGDPFFSRTADYQVALTVPADHQVVASGSEQSRSLENGQVTVTYSGQGLRDFAFLTSARLQSKSEQVNQVLFTTAWWSEQSAAMLALDIAKRSVACYSRLFGEYAYPELTVAESQLGLFGGMEYPSLVVLGPYGQRETAVAEAARVEQEVAHEVAHQWWYAAVGNDQIRDPWLDESLATYSSILYLADRYGQSVLDEFRSRTEFPQNPISGNLYAFANWATYYATVYQKGAHALDELRQRLGDEVFLQFLQDYYKTYKGDVATPAEFLAKLHAIDQATADWFEEQLAGGS